MKIGILTFHYAYNYGAILQCYALQQTLIEIGYRDVDIINVRAKRWQDSFQGIPKKLNFTTIKKTLIKLHHSNEIKKVLDEFRNNNLHCTNKIEYSNLSKFAEKYDAIIVGSDQIWTPTLHKFKLYFLNWNNPHYNGLKIAYAPCCGFNFVHPKYKNELSKALNSFDVLSARNKETQNFVKAICDKQVDLAPDPTILYDFKEIPQVNCKYTNYILCFILGNDINGGNSKAISVLKSTYPDSKVIAIVSAKSNPIIANWADIIIYNASIPEWISYIKNAKFVFTDSFHCTIFCLKYGKKFAAYYSMPSRKARFIDLIERYKLGKHIVSSIEELKITAELEPINCENILTEQKEYGRQFIKHSLLLTKHPNIV